MDDKLLVYVCSNPEDKVSREVVAFRLQKHPGLRIFTQELGVASTKSDAEMRLDKTRRCDIFILVVGERLSQELEGEYREALNSNKSILVFAEERYADSPGIALVQALYGGHIQAFSKVMELGDLCAASVDAHIIEKYRQARSEGSVTLPSPGQYSIDALIPKTLVGRDADLKRLRDWVQTHQNGFLVVHGKSGVGKTGLLSTFARSADAIRVSVSDTYQGNPRLVLHSLIEQISVRLGLRDSMSADAGTVELSNHLKQLLLMRTEQKIILVIDALDEVCSPSDGTPFFQLLPEKAPENTVFVLSTNNPHRDARPEWIPFELLPLQRTDVLRYLKDLKVPEKFHGRLASAAKGYPLFLELLKRDVDSTSVTEASSVEDYLRSIWKRYSGPELDLLTLIAINRGPVSTDLACAFLGCARNQLERSLDQIRQFVDERHGTVGLFHELLRSALLKYIGKAAIRDGHLRIVKAIAAHPTLPQWHVAYHLYSAREFAALLALVDPGYLKQQKRAGCQLDEIQLIASYCFRAAVEEESLDAAVKYAILYASFVDLRRLALPDKFLEHLAATGRHEQALLQVRRRFDPSSLATGYLAVARGLSRSDEKQIASSILRQAVELVPRLSPESRETILDQSVEAMMNLDPDAAISIMEQRIQERGSYDWREVVGLLPADPITLLKVLQLVDSQKTRIMLLSSAVAHYHIPLDDFLEMYKLLPDNAGGSCLLAYLLTNGRLLAPIANEWLLSEMQRFAQNVYKDDWAELTLAVLRNLVRVPNVLDFSVPAQMWKSLSGQKQHERLDVLSYLIRLTRQTRPRDLPWLLDELPPLLRNFTLDSVEDALIAVRLSVALGETDKELSDELTFNAMSVIERLGNEQASLSETYLLPTALELLELDINATLLLLEKCEYPWQLGDLYHRVLTMLYSPQRSVSLSPESARRVLDATIWVQNFRHSPVLFAKFIQLIARQPKRNALQLSDMGVEAVLWSSLSQSVVAALGALASAVYPLDSDRAEDLLTLAYEAGRTLDLDEQATCYLAVADSLNGQAGLVNERDMLLNAGIRAHEINPNPVDYWLRLGQLELLMATDANAESIAAQFVGELLNYAETLLNLKQRVFLLSAAGVLCGKFGLQQQCRSIARQTHACIRAHGLVQSCQGALANLAQTMRRWDLDAALRIAGDIQDVNYRKEILLEILRRDMPEFKDLDRMMTVLESSPNDDSADDLCKIACELVKSELAPQTLVAQQRLAEWCDQHVHYLGYKLSCIASITMLGYDHDPVSTMQQLELIHQRTEEIANVSDRVICLGRLSVAMPRRARKKARAFADEAFALLNQISVVEEWILRVSALAELYERVDRKYEAIQVLVRALERTPELDHPARRRDLTEKLLVALGSTDQVVLDRLLPKYARWDPSLSVSVYRQLSKEVPAEQAAAILEKLVGTEYEADALNSYLKRLPPRDPSKSLGLQLLTRPMEIGLRQTLNAVKVLLVRRADPNSIADMFKEWQDTVSFVVAILAEESSPSGTGSSDPLNGSEAVPTEPVHTPRFVVAPTVWGEIERTLRGSAVTFVTNRYDGQEDVTSQDHTLLTLSLRGGEAPRVPAFTVSEGHAWYLWGPPDDVLRGIPLPAWCVTHLTSQLVDRFVGGCLFNGRPLVASV